MLERLTQDRVNWRKNHPFGFWCKPVATQDNSSVNLQVWHAGIPGPINSAWAGGMFRLELRFPDAYPSVPPTVTFTPPLFHPNIYPNGAVCLDLLSPEGWNSNYTVAHVLVSVQTLLVQPNPASPAQVDAYNLFVNDYARYESVVRETARRFRDENLIGDGDDDDRMRDD